METLVSEEANPLAIHTIRIQSDAQEYLTDQAFAGGCYLYFANNSEFMFGLESSQIDSAETRIFAFDLQTYKRQVLQEEYSEIQDIAASPTGDAIYSIDRQGEIRVWNIK